MDDIAGKIAELLGSPEGLEKINGLSGLLGQSLPAASPPPAPEPAQEPSAAFPFPADKMCIRDSNGETPLFFLNDNPVTLEAIVYGAAIAVMLISVIFWFKCLNDVMTSDKFLYLFGRLIPKLSLILSMALRFVPLFKAQIKKIHQTQKTLGLYASKSVADRLLGGFRVLSVLITWSLENAVDTAASMKARGYGIKGRTSFSLFRFRAEDGALLGAIAALCALVFLGFGGGRLDFHYYPYISPLTFDFTAWLGYAAALLLFFLPFAIEIKENLQWKYLRSRI